MPIVRSKRKRARAIGAHRSRGCAGSEQQPCHLRMPIGRRIVQRSVPFAVAGSHRRACIQQRLYGRRMPIECRMMQCGDVVSLCIHRHTAITERLHRLRLPKLRSRVKCGVAGTVPILSRRTRL